MRPTLAQIAARQHAARQACADEYEELDVRLGHWPREAAHRRAHRRPNANAVNPDSGATTHGAYTMGRKQARECTGDSMSSTPAPVRRRRHHEAALARRRAHDTTVRHHVTVIDRDTAKDITGYLGLHCDSGRHAICHAVFDCDCAYLRGYEVNADGLPVHEGWDPDADEYVDHVGEWSWYCQWEDQAVMDGALYDWVEDCHEKGIPFTAEARITWDGTIMTASPVRPFRQPLHYRKARKLVRA